MMEPLKVSRSTVKVLVQPSGAGTCSFSGKPAAVCLVAVFLVFGISEA